MIRVSGLGKAFVTQHTGTVRALDKVSLSVPKGKVFTMLGPSGCGKTTLLRCIAGLETPDEGEIHIGDHCVFSKSARVFVPPERRKMGMVFQSYAIWPHMTVLANCAYPLRAGGRLAAGDIRERALGALRLVGMEGLAHRPAPLLSGGQQQRVALARALVAEPSVLLFDEPLSNLDAKLRLQMRGELRELLRRLETTAVYVTHDQEEALAISDLVAVMAGGRVVEVGTPAQLYLAPQHRFTAQFLGKPNLVAGTVLGHDGQHWVVETSIGRVRTATGQHQWPAGTPVEIMIRPEHIEMLEQPVDRPNLFPAQRLRSMFMGAVIQHEVQVGDITFEVLATPRDIEHAHDQPDQAPAYVRLRAGRCHLLATAGAGATAAAEVAAATG